MAQKNKFLWNSLKQKKRKTNNELEAVVDNSWSCEIDVCEDNDTQTTTTHEDSVHSESSDENGSNINEIDITGKFDGRRSRVRLSRCQWESAYPWLYYSEV